MIDFNLTNVGDSAYMTTLVLAYPNMLLFNKFTMVISPHWNKNDFVESLEQDLRLEILDQLCCIDWQRSQQLTDYCSGHHSQKMEGSVCENQVKENISYLKCRLLHPVFKKNTQVPIPTMTSLIQPSGIAHAKYLPSKCPFSLTCQQVFFILIP